MKAIRYVSSFIIVLLLAAALAFSCAVPSPAPSPTPAPTTAPTPTPAVPIKVGVDVGLTGFMAPDAADCVRGVQLRLDEANYEVAGRKIELMVEDGASDVTVYVDKARKLVQQDEVDVILGPLFSPGGFAVADYLKTSKTPNITFMEHSHGVLEFGGKNVFLWPGTLLGKGYPLGKYAYDTMGYRTATAIYADMVNGEEFAGGVIKSFEEKGGKVVLKQTVPPDAMDFAAYLPNMKNADFVIAWFQYPGRAPFIKQAQSFGLNKPILIPNFATFTEQILSEIGDACVGMLGSAHYTPLIDTDVNKKFVDAFVKKYGMQPRGESVGGYIAALLFLEAVKATGGDTSHDAINKALLNIKADTPAGTFSFTPEGLGIGDIYIAKVVKIGDRYAWQPIYKYSQIVLDVPK